MIFAYRLLFGCLLASALTVSAAANDLIFPGETWVTATPAEMGVDPMGLEAALRLLPNSNRTMVIRDGRVIWQGPQFESKHHVFSITKSFASTAAGILVDDGIISVNTKVADYIPEYQDRYSELTFEHLLKQSGGIGGNLLHPGEPLFEPGTQFVYNLDTDNHALSYGLSEAADMSFEDIIVSRIAEPIGMDLKELSFETLTERFQDRTAEFQRANYGLSISASNLARYGLLYLNDGVWDGERILSSEWIEQATQVQVKGVPNHPRSIGNFVGTFGYGWWILDPSGQFNAFGAANNHLLVDPVAGFVVVTLGAEGSDTAFLSGLENAEYTYEWDGQGNGSWQDLDPGTGQSRWTVNGAATTSLPRSRSLIRGGVVTLENAIRGRSVEIEDGGALIVQPSAEVVAGQLSVSEGGQLTARGSLELGRLDVRGAATLRSMHPTEIAAVSVNGGYLEIQSSQNASIAALGQLSGRGDATVVIDGPLELLSLSLRDSHLVLKNGQGTVSVDSTFRVSNESTWTFVLDDETWERTVTVGERIRPTFSDSELVLELDPAFNAQVLEGARLNLFDWGDREPRHFESVSVPSRIEADFSDLYSKGELVITSVLSEPTSPGDFNADDVLDATDVDALLARIRADSSDLYYDADDNGSITQDDLSYWLGELKDSRMGDADLNGKVEFMDFITLSSNFNGLGGWQQGDFNGDGRIAFADFVLLSANYEGPPAVAVPESSTTTLALVGILLLTLAHRRRA